MKKPRVLKFKENNPTTFTCGSSKEGLEHIKSMIKPRVWTLFKGRSDYACIDALFWDKLRKLFKRKPFPCEIVIREITSS